MVNPDMQLLKLTVNNHPGVLSHVSGLFARRAYNLEGVMVRPVRSDASRSRMWLLVQEEDRLEQITRQLEKLEDVLSVEHEAASESIFSHTETFFQ